MIDIQRFIDFLDNEVSHTKHPVTGLKAIERTYTKLTADQRDPMKFDRELVRLMLETLESVAAFE